MEAIDEGDNLVNLYFAITIAGYTLEFSVGFARTLEVVIAVRDESEVIRDFDGTVYGSLQPDGTFIPDGVSIEDQNQTG